MERDDNMAMEVFLFLWEDSCLHGPAHMKEVALFLNMVWTILSVWHLTVSQHSQNVALAVNITN